MALAAYAQPTWNSPSAFGVTNYLPNTIHDVKFRNSSEVWAVGANGVIMVSYDAGATWSNVASGTGNDLYAIHFVSASEGAIVGTNTVMTTVDGGASWQLKTAPTSSIFRDVHMVSATELFIIQDGTIFRTTDGGNNWSNVYSPGGSNFYNAITFHTATNGIMVGGGPNPFGGAFMAYTTNGGLTWTQRIVSVSFRMQDIHMINANEGWVVGHEGGVAYTSDGGATWTEQTSGSSFEFFSVCFLNDQEGFAVGEFSSIIYTVDGGSNWNSLEFITSNDYRAIDFSGANACFGGTNNVLAYSVDTGMNWEISIESSIVVGNLFAVDMVNEFEAWAAGANGVVIHTSDGGLNWTQQDTYVSDFLTAIDFFDNQTGCVVGSSGTILFTTDGGLSWSEDSYPIYLRGVSFATATDAWIVGDEGTILYTNDGGLTLSPQTSGTLANLWGVRFVDDSTGYAVGDGGTILHTSDGGNTWNPQTSGVSDILMSIYFIDENTGFIVGQNGVLLRTTNGGSTWETLTSGTPNGLFSISFATPTDGWACGFSGTLIKTTDGGNNWEIVSGVSSAVLRGISMTSLTSGLMVGTNGAIIVYDCATPTPTASATQTLCNGATVAELVADATEMIWYTVPSFGTPLLASELLDDGFYYGAQVIDGCESKERVEVSFTLNFAPSTPNGINGMDVVCENSTNNYSISVDPEATNYNWSFDNGGTLTNNLNETELTITTSGTLTITTENACGSSLPLTLEITVKPLPQLIGLNSAGICSGEAVNLSLSASEPSTFDWFAADNVDVDGESATPQFSDVITDVLTITGAGNQAVEYTVTPTSFDGCIGASEVYHIDIYAQPVLSSTPTDDPTQCGLATGGLLGAQASGNQPIVFYWYEVVTSTLVGTNADLTNQPAADFYVDLIDSWGCTAQFGNFTITSLAPPSAPAGDAVQTFCFSAALNELTIQGSNITWYDDATDGTVLTAGTPLQDGSSYYASQFIGGCESDDRFEVVVTIHNAGNELVLTVTPSESECNENTGGATVAITGGTTPYDILWDNGSQIASANALSAGIHYVNVADALGCTSFASFMINTNAGPQITLDNIMDNGCAGDNNGAISINVSGGESPYTFQWSNHATTQNITNLAYGCYEVTVTDANGCQAADVYFVDEPAPLYINHTTSAPSCATANGIITLVVGGGVGPYQYAWSTGATTSGLSSVAAGVYTVTVGDANGCEKAQTIILNEVGSSGVVLESIVTNDCEATTGSAFVFALRLDNTFLWSDNSTDEDLINVPGGIYTLEVTNGDGCKSYLSAAIVPQQPQGVEICIVSVDETTNTNMVLWEKPVTTEISFFNIYRESCQQGVYHLIHTQAYADESLYEDDLANTDTRGWRYKISAVNSCGEESERSDAHRAIHLMMTESSGAYTLIWTDYEGFEVTTHDVYRYTTSIGAELLAALPAGINTYSDTPTAFDDLSYFVVADPGYTCTSSRANINTSRSNTKGGIAPEVVDGITDLLSNAVALYPNPTTNLSQLFIPTQLVGSTVTLTNAVGQVMTTLVATNTTLELDLGTYANGLYVVKIATNSGVITKKLVKE
jgi:photosystem II stability/assembly factor-like uncharacterized protein